MIWSVAWKNIWRNKVRSTVVIVAITIGLFGGTFSAAVMNGMVMRRVHSAVNQEVSHVQIHHTDFMVNKDPEFTLGSPKELLDTIRVYPEVEAATSRIISEGMASTARKNEGVKIISISPEEERKVTTLHQLLLDTTSTYFGTKTRYPILVGKELAEKMNLKIRSRVKLSFQTLDGYGTQGAFKVVGIYKTDNSTYNKANVFIRKKDFCKLSGFPKDAAHEIAILLKDRSQTKAVTERLSQQFPKVLAEGYTTLAPDLAMTAEYMEVFMLFLTGIVLLAMGFGIVNTMLMVVLERIREFGMLMAIGMNKGRVFLMVMLETVYLLIFGGGIGMLISHFMTLYYGKVGISLEAYEEGFSALGYAPILYPEISFSSYLNISILVIVTGILSSIYPAIKAIKLNPSEAIRSV